MVVRTQQHNKILVGSECFFRFRRNREQIDVHQLGISAFDFTLRRSEIVWLSREDKKVKFRLLQAVKHTIAVD